MDSGRTTYILRVWPEAQRTAQTGRLVCSLQVPSTQETYYFPSLEAALEFIRLRARRKRPAP